LNNYVNTDLIFDPRPTIAFHKNCVDGIFSAYLFIKAMNLDNYNLLILSPHQLHQIKITNSLYAILDLPLFTSKTQYYFDHHITNLHISKNKIFKGKYDNRAPSTCQLIERFFNLDNKFGILVKIANCIDQAAFGIPPPIESSNLDYNSFDDIVWACNDLIKHKKTENEFYRLWDSLSNENLGEWIQKHSQTVKNHRELRKKALSVIPYLNRAPVMIIEHNEPIQSESIHLSLTFDEIDLKITIFCQKMKGKNQKADSFRWNFRQNPKLSNIEKKIYRVDEIALQLGGGGHQTVASATTNQKRSAFNKIMQWLEKNNIEVATTQLH
jgi:hypothetical protein